MVQGNGLQNRKASGSNPDVSSSKKALIERSGLFFYQVFKSKHSKNQLSSSHAQAQLCH